MSINNKIRETEEKVEMDKTVIEYPKNYNDIVEFKLKRIEREYQETINKDFSKEDLANNEDFDSDSEEEVEEAKENNNNNNNHYQCLDGEEFVDVFENNNDQEEEKKESKVNIIEDYRENKDWESNVNYPPANFITSIDEKKFEEFVKVSERVLEENKEYLGNLNNIQGRPPAQIQIENIYDYNDSSSMKNESNKFIKLDNNVSNYSENTNNYDTNEFEFVSDNSKSINNILNNTIYFSN